VGRTSIILAWIRPGKTLGDKIPKEVDNGKHEPRAEMTGPQQPQQTELVIKVQLWARR
jgi:hypothetical protein